MVWNNFIMSSGVIKIYFQKKICSQNFEIITKICNSLKWLLNKSLKPTKDNHKKANKFLSRNEK